MDPLKTIIENGLSIRQVPLQVVSLLDITNAKEGEEIVEHEITTANYKWIVHNMEKRPESYNLSGWRLDHKNKRVFRKFVRRVKIPNHAGYWMCQQVKGTSAGVEWSSKIHNLAPTLDESVALFIKNSLA